MEIQEGELKYKDVNIKVFRGPQGGCFAIVWSGWEHDKTLSGMIGYGVYGYDGEEWVGVTEETIKWFEGKLQESHPMFTEEDLDSLPEEKKQDLLQNNKTFDLDIPDCFRQFSLKDGVRFNQGDAFFAKNLGVQTPTTEAGKAEKPILTSILKK